MVHTELPFSDMASTFSSAGTISENIKISFLGRVFLIVA